jgi:galactokinase
MPDGVWAAPGRVNLVGEHTDYNSGLVFPLAVDREAVAAVAVRDDGVVTCASLDVAGDARIRLEDLRPGGVHGWAAYVLGVVWALRGVAGAGAGGTGLGFDVVVGSDVPAGAGLASSAALGAAVAAAVAELTGCGMGRTQLAVAVRRGENEMVGAPVGIMDPMAALHGRAGCALLLDCRSLEIDLVPLHLRELGLRILVVDTRVRHANAAGGYAARRRACEQAAAQLGVDSLRDATVEAVDGLADGDAKRCARHVVTENARVRETAAALGRGDVASVGAVFASSHASMRDDFRISCVELDLAVTASVGSGAVAARMTGGGFGGCVVALVPAGRCAEVAGALGRAFRDRGFLSPNVFEVLPSDGARRIDSANPAFSAIVS